jgi:ribonuclease T1
MTGSLPNLLRRLAAVIAVAACVVAPAALARTTADDLPALTRADLPKEARAVLAAIRAGGPFHYDRDGVVFGNYEKLLPAKARGHYHEYTVPTPGIKGRGARRIVCGGARTSPDACYYSDDHYQSFRRIRE